MKTLPLAVLLILLATSAMATDRFFLAPGMTSESGATVNLGLGRDWSQRWFESETGHLGGYWHVGYTWWESGDFGREAHTLSFSPVFLYQFEGPRWRPFLEAGIGAAWFSRSKVGDRNLGSRLHFEDRFGAGVHLGERDRLMLRVIHYSNAGLDSPNQGINAWTVTWSRAF